MGGSRALLSLRVLLLLKIGKHRAIEECILSTYIRLPLPEDVAMVGNIRKLSLCWFLGSL